MNGIYHFLVDRDLEAMRQSYQAKGSRFHHRDSTRSAR
jgi:hypothetical protein